MATALQKLLGPLKGISRYPAKLGGALYKPLVRPLRSEWGQRAGKYGQYAGAAVALGMGGAALAAPAAGAAAAPAVGAGAATVAPAVAPAAGAAGAGAAGAVGGGTVGASTTPLMVGGQFVQGTAPIMTAGSGAGVTSIGSTGAVATPAGVAGGGVGGTGSATAAQGMSQMDKIRMYKAMMESVNGQGNGPPPRQAPAGPLAIPRAEPIPSTLAPAGMGAGGEAFGSGFGGGRAYEVLAPQDQDFYWRPTV